MAVSVVPALKGALFDAAVTAAPDVLVSYGVAVTDDPGDYLMIGVSDPDADDWTGLTSTTRQWESVGIVADVREEGDIPCAALSWNGAGDARTACETVYAIAETLAAVVRANPNLGLIEVSWCLFGESTELLEIQTDTGAIARLDFTIRFVALI